jgi:hypothetical protein
MALESVVVMGTVADLVQRLEWPPHLVEVETPDYVFDFAAYVGDAQGEAMVIAGEAKASQRIADQWMSELRGCGSDHDHQLDAHSTASSKNAHKKFSRLLEVRPPYLWVVGPRFRTCFRVRYHDLAATFEVLGNTPPSWSHFSKD